MFISTSRYLNENPCSRGSTTIGSASACTLSTSTNEQASDETGKKWQSLLLPEEHEHVRQLQRNGAEVGRKWHVVARELESKAVALG